MPVVDPVTRRPRRARRWPAWVAGALLVLAGASTLAARPWASAEPLPFPSPPLTASTEPATALPSVLPTVVAPQFDATTATGLFLTRPELEDTLPSEDALSASPVLPWAWGIPEGSRVEPARCTVARTVVTTPPVAYHVRGWNGGAVQVRQEVLVVADQAAAADAFRTLVVTLDSCPEYAQLGPGTGASWVGEPAAESRGRFPSLWQELRRTAEGTTTPGYRGHLLVGNAIVTWSVEVVGDVDPGDVESRAGEGAALDELVQRRAAQAVAELR